MTTVCIVILTYIKPLEEIDEAIPAHVEWLKKGYAEGLFMTSGRRISRNGGVFSLNARVLLLLKSAYARILFRG